jgi:glutamate-1-semialdehyde 2,1-aminomutase
LADGLKQRIARRGLHWHVTTVGARSELLFAAGPSRTARESFAASAPALERLLHLYLLNRGVLVTPFHNMMLMSPATTRAQVDLLLTGFEHWINETWIDETGIDETGLDEIS